MGIGIAHFRVCGAKGIFLCIDTRAGVRNRLSVQFNSDTACGKICVGIRTPGTDRQVCIEFIGNCLAISHIGRNRNRIGSLMLIRNIDYKFIGVAVILRSDPEGIFSRETILQQQLHLTRLCNGRLLAAAGLVERHIRNGNMVRIAADDGQGIGQHSIRQLIVIYFCRCSGLTVFTSDGSVKPIVIAQLQRNIIGIVKMDCKLHILPTNQCLHCYCIGIGGITFRHRHRQIIPVRSAAD